ncbi:MAG: 5-(carboxyamino)imidazole ribonucleotide synthase, partial [Gemmatimonadetes bacterium]|nr:5-(carboxyamino)imidazole ribonucleotide synthase [Gemmatimonadota bacterium]NIR76826.1 5-(carboxyamino)imidazole ribonucleotide synthase [Gemmatimonadota bacterium]NIT85345.1 5-(carboxyamino)imidazole ribonucleotide synthase [Gemmatimonadota bacterium]NIU29165.1 5-(carboxyamino)imidazole ribonucleotide synthase [Gemmatimonadota bacterium]NIU34264.1 5-(carboxyamino)imidazole ribonucleotide synthase [Gemmatimonadota bacterium]
MLALAGYPLGLEFRFLEPKESPPVAHLGELISGDYDDPGALDA